MSPTGYTAGVQDGTIADFRTFALQCARGFGACLMQRDDPAGDLPKLRTVSKYTVERLASAEQELANLQAMPEDERLRSSIAANAEALNHYRDMCEEARQTENRYRAMLAAVEAWTPPTPDHEELKRFMSQQLNESLRWDLYTPIEPVSYSAGAWYTHTLERAKEAVRYARESLEKETESVAKSNAWITALYESLPEPGGTDGA